ncbi:MAG: hypothetical protein HQL11_00085 [Candidatus Omnitrophica bacterium]|nr:hypothetical protein [Candidatus Omnitrophota bacterium]
MRRTNSKIMVSVLMDRVDGGITLGECAGWNKRFRGYLEEAALTPQPCEVEVASPGIDRPFKTLNQCRRAIGKKIELVMVLDGGVEEKAVWRLAELRGSILVLENEKGSPERHEVSWDSVRSVRAVVEF